MTQGDSASQNELQTLHLLLAVTLEQKLTTCNYISNSVDLLERIPELAGSCDYLIVDGSAGLSETTKAILFRADLAVVPCQPTGVDLIPILYEAALNKASRMKS